MSRLLEQNIFNTKNQRRAGVPAPRPNTQKKTCTEHRRGLLANDCDGMVRSCAMVRLPTFFRRSFANLMNLVPCPGCSRHIRIAERECPFCGSALSANLASKVIPGSTQRLSRAAAFVFTTTLAVTGCGDSSPTPDAAAGDAVADNGGPGPLYGAPADDGGIDAIYGAPPDARVDAAVTPDARTDAAVTPDVTNDNGGIVPLYGAVPAPDAGEDGSIGIRYGAPPRDV
jgi:hypothetical protein